MLGQLVRAAAVAASGLLLSGCLTFGQIQDRGESLNDGIGQMQNRALLLNIVRASRGEPLYFTTLSQANGQANFDFKVGAPSFATGAGLTAAQKALSINPSGSTSLDNSTFTNFQLQLYSSKEFYAGLLAPIELPDVYMLSKQGFSRELLFYLLIESAKVTFANGTSVLLTNDPSNPDPANRYEFNAYIKQAMIHGLSFEVVPASKVSGPAGQAGAATGPTVRLCFEPSLVTAEGRGDFDQAKSMKVAVTMCGDPISPGSEDQSGGVKVVLGGQVQTVGVNLRTIYGVFKYLGAMVAHPDAAPQLVDYHVPSEVTEEGPLLDVRREGDVAFDRCFAAIVHAEQRYCVPDANGQVSRSVFDVVSTLVELKQSPSQLPATSTVLIGG
jgi:hypothetical protein